MMNESWIVLILMALMLGVQHGFDLDHLATIDSVTRTVSNNRHLARRVGFLFSFGHGLVVISISLIIGSGLMQSHIPAWLNEVGNWISIVFLFIFGLANLWNVLHVRSNSVIPITLKHFVFRQLNHSSLHPVWIILIGALFAFSFDTFTQIALFSISASLLSGCLFSVTLGLLFMFGMMMADGLNGLFVSALIQRADKISQFISRVAGLLIALFSLAIGLINLSKMMTHYA